MPSIGGQIGNKNNAKGKDWQDALRKAMIQYESADVPQGQALFKIATKVVQQALEGDPTAWQEIGNRLDGKPAQALQLSSDDDKPLFQAIKMVIVANNPNQINGLANNPATIEGELVQEKITVSDNMEGQGTGVHGPVDETPPPHLRVPNPSVAEVNLEPSADE